MASEPAKISEVGKRTSTVRSPVVDVKIVLVIVIALSNPALHITYGVETGAV